MIGIILAGGRGNRLSPVTLATNKHILPVGNHPMIYYPLSMLISSGIKKIVIVTGPPHETQVKKVVKNLTLFKKASIKFVQQPKPLGMPNAISKTGMIVGGNSIIVVSGDNIFGGTYEKYIKGFVSGEISFLRKVKDPRKYAVPVYDKSKRLQNIIEKPKKTNLKLAICGPHIFDNNVFKYIKKLKLSSRGEFEIVDLHKMYHQAKQLSLIKANDYWMDLGNFEDLAVTSYLLTKQKIKINYDNI